MRISQLTKIQNGPRLEKNSTEELFWLPSKHSFQIYANDSQPENKLFDVPQMQIRIATFRQIKDSVVW